MTVKIRAGPNKDSLAIVSVNDEENPIEFDGPNFQGRILVRIRDFDGVTPYGKKKIKNIDYFTGRYRKFSIQVEGRFKNEWSADEVFFGNEFDHEVIVPVAAPLAIRIAKSVDPAVFYDIEGPRPWIMSPLICALNVMDAWSLPEPQTDTASDDSSTSEKISSLVGPWRQHLADNPSAFVPSGKRSSRILNAFQNPRRSHFLSNSNRESFTFTPDKVYGFEFFAPYMDFNTFHLHMGAKFNVSKYLNGQSIRYTCQSKANGGEVFWMVDFMLVEDDEQEEVNEKE